MIGPRDEYEAHDLRIETRLDRYWDEQDVDDRVPETDIDAQDALYERGAY